MIIKIDDLNRLWQIEKYSDKALKKLDRNKTILYIALR